jgi:putative CocE/NonD family hydrolase
MKSKPIDPRPSSFAAVSIVFAVFVVAAVSSPARSQQVSTFGSYSGYTAPAYDGWVRRGEYAPMPDGTQIAVNYFVPAAAGVEASTPLPVILLYTRYLRVWEDGGAVRSMVDEESLARELLRYGYVLAIANARGTGASTGYRNGEFSTREQEDAYHIVEWLAARDWCDGHVGMWGRSYSGMTAYNAAAQAPPHLDAVLSEMSGPMVYELIYPGGAYQDEFIRVWSNLVRDMDTGRQGAPARMDSDPSGAMRDAAVAEHADN